YGEGNQTRSFCYVDDLIGAFIRLMATGNEITGPINLGNPNEFTIIELAKTVIEMTNSKSDLKFVALPSDDPKQRRPDISLAQAQLGWQPNISLHDGLARTIPYFEQMIAAGVQVNTWQPA
ncbi:MAG: SDR family NAD-dependent epimerase/dehydratase, partial [Alcaligenaceae bacterium]